MNLDCDLKKGACYINLGEIAKYLVLNYQGEKGIMAGWKIDEGKKYEQGLMVRLPSS